MTPPAAPDVPDFDRLLAISEAGSRGAATALSQILGRPVDLEVSWARRVPAHEVADVAGGAARPICALRLEVLGDVRGVFLLLFGREQVPLLLALLMPEAWSGAPARAPGAGEDPRPRPGRKMAHTAEALSALQESALREVGNILAAAYLNAVSHLLGTSLLISPPDLALDRTQAITDGALHARPEGGDRLVLMSEVQEPHSGLRGSIVFLPEAAGLEAPDAHARRP